MYKLIQIITLLAISANLFAQPVLLKKASPVSANISEVQLTNIDKMLQQYVDSGWANGAIGFIARDGKVVYNKAFGWDDIDLKTPIKADGIFRIASQTKAITSVAVMMLFEKGKFLLDDPISKYIPEFANPQVLASYNNKDTTYTTVPACREITIRDLLTHTSGIDYASIGSPNMVAIYKKAGIPASDFNNNRLILGNEIRKLGKLPLIHNPGEKFTYGLNVDVLGYLVEVVSGMDLNTFFSKNIFEPLQMNDTYFNLPASKHSRLIKLYTENESHQLVLWKNDKDISYSQVDSNYPNCNKTYFSGGGGLSSTIEDYAIFLQMLLNNGEYNGHRILSKSSVELMTMNQIGDLVIDKNNKFGLGFQIATPESQARLGLTPGTFSWGGFFGSIYWVDPKEKLVCQLCLQLIPLKHVEIQDKFRAMVYQSLK